MGRAKGWAPSRSLQKCGGQPREDKVIGPPPLEEEHGGGPGQLLYYNACGWVSGSRTSNRVSPGFDCT
jgi:hypothetical protein